jgi:putative FmdB family regulatory protein
LPIYVFQCKSCETVHEKLLKMSDRDTFVVNNSCECGGDLKNIISLPAFTPGLYGDQTGKYGASGYYSKSLGGYVDNKRVEEKLMKDRGFIREADLGKDFWEKETSKRKSLIKEQDLLSDEYSGLLKDGFSKEDAIAKTFSTERIMSGELDRIYGTKPKENSL